MPMTEKCVVVIAGPSGSGKNSVIEAIVARCSKCTRLVTATTRAPRPGEADGVDYHFLSKERFDGALRDGDILEHRFVESLGTHYGVYKPDLEGRIARGEIVLAHLDIVGARYLKAHYNATTIFILPDSLDELEARIRARNTNMADAEIAARMKIAKTEMEEHAPQYDYRVVNSEGKLDEAIEKVMAIMRTEGYDLGI
jgi:guanylate kinase